MSAWRLVPLGLTCCIVGWIVLSGALSVVNIPAAKQGTVLVPLPPPRVVNEHWSPMLTLGGLRAIANGSSSPTFKPSDLRHWQVVDEYGDNMCDAPLQVSLFNEFSEAQLRDEFRLGAPFEWLTVIGQEESHRLHEPLVRRTASPIVDWRLHRKLWFPTLFLQRADGRPDVATIHVQALLVPVAVGTVLWILLGVVRWHHRASERWKRSLRLGLLVLVASMYLFPSWTPDRAYVFGSSGWSTPTRVTLSEVFAMSDSAENARGLAADIVRAIDETPRRVGWVGAPRDSDILVCGYVADPSHDPAAAFSGVQVGPFLLASHWEVKNARPESVGSFWHFSGPLQVFRRVQASDRVTLTIVELGTILQLLSLVFGPVYITWIARRLWLNRRSRRRRYAKQCAACGYQLVRTSES